MGTPEGTGGHNARCVSNPTDKGTCNSLYYLALFKLHRCLNNSILLTKIVSMLASVAPL